MHWLHTFSLVIRSNVTALCEHFEDPERVLNQLLIEADRDLLGCHTDHDAVCRVRSGSHHLGSDALRHSHVRNM